MNTPVPLPHDSKPRDCDIAVSVSNFTDYEKVNPNKTIVDNASPDRFRWDTSVKKSLESNVLMPLESNSQKISAEKSKRSKGNKRATIADSSEPLLPATSEKQKVKMELNLSQTKEDSVLEQSHKKSYSEVVKNRSSKSSLKMLKQNLTTLLECYPRGMPLDELSVAYRRKYNCSLDYQEHGYLELLDLLFDMGRITVRPVDASNVGATAAMEEELILVAIERGTCSVVERKKKIYWHKISKWQYNNNTNIRIATLLTYKEMKE